MPKPTAGMELPSPSETRESALLQVSEAMALLIRTAETKTNPAKTAVAPSCGMQDYDVTSVWEYEISSHDYMDETYMYSYENTYDLDEDYNRDSTDYAHLAYVHYA